MTTMQSRELLMTETSCITAKQQLRSLAEGYPQPLIVIGCCILCKDQEWVIKKNTYLFFLASGWYIRGMYETVVGKQILKQQISL
jgi:hypothetical protein